MSHGDRFRDSLESNTRGLLPFCKRRAQVPGTGAQWHVFRDTNPVIT